MPNEINLDSLDPIIRKLVKAKADGINMVVVWRPNYDDDDTNENRPDWIGCNFSDPKLAQALLGHTSQPEDSGCGDG